MRLSGSTTPIRPKFWRRSLNGWTTSTHELMLSRTSTGPERAPPRESRDRSIRGTERGPLDGIVFTIKDSVMALLLLVRIAAGMRSCNFIWRRRCVADSMTSHLSACFVAPPVLILPRHCPPARTNALVTRYAAARPCQAKDALRPGSTPVVAALVAADRG